MTILTIRASAPRETELVRQIAQGDREAFGSLYGLYSKPLFSFASHTLNDPSDAEDVLQEVFLKIWEKAPSFNEGLGNPFNWALTMTRNKSIDCLRARRRKFQVFPEPGESVLATEQVEEPPPLATIGPDESTHLRAAVNELPHDQRLPIQLAFFGGLTHGEIADTLQAPLGTIKARIRRGMFQLRNSLEGTEVGVLAENIFASPPKYP